mgnify:CR=1 FL=1
MISVNNVSVSFGAKPLFEDISFVISAKERIALVGKNGAGKSTLLKLLAGIAEPTEGIISRPKGISIGYLPQVMKTSDERTVLGECQQVFSHITEVERLAEEMATRTDYDSTDYMELIERHAQRSDQLLMHSTGSIEANIEKTLLGLGFERFRTLDPNLAHVRHVENTHAVAYGQVLLNNSFILDRHIVAGKLVHLGAQGDVHVGKRCCFHLLFYLFGDDVT